MKTLVVFAVLVIMSGTVIWVHRKRTVRGHGASSAGVGRLHFRHRRHRRAAALQAKSLANAIMDCRQDPTVHLAAGVVLQPGEIAWTRSRARLTMRSSQMAWVACTQMGWWGRRPRNVNREKSTSGWEDSGKIEWLITSQRLVGRLPVSAELISLWWSGLIGVDVDLHHDKLTLNGVNGWTGRLSGPEIFPLAVAAVGMCHGPEALADHPGLSRLPTIEGRPATAPFSEPRALTEGATILRIQNRRRTS